MSRKRRVHSAAFKGKVALEALKELTPINVLASQYEIQPNQISTWKKQLKEGVSEIFSRKRGKAKEDTRKAEKRLYEEIGRLKMELDWLKKKSEPNSDPIDLIDSNHKSISIQRQCDLLGISRSRYYYKPGSTETRVKDRKNSAIMDSRKKISLFIPSKSEAAAVSLQLRVILSAC